MAGGDEGLGVVGAGPAVDERLAVDGHSAGYFNGYRLMDDDWDGTWNSDWDVFNHLDGYSAWHRYNERVLDHEWDRRVEGAHLVGQQPPLGAHAGHRRRRHGS